MKFPSSSSSDSPFLKSLQYFLLISLILYFGQTLFVPLSFSVLISFLLYPICRYLENHKLNRSTAIFISMGFLLLLLTLIIGLLFQQILKFSLEWPALKTKLVDVLYALSSFITERFHISKEAQDIWLSNLFNSSGSGMLTLLKNIIYSSGVWLVLAILIPLFSALLLYYREQFARVLYSLFLKEKEGLIREILQKTVHTYYNFVKGMLLVYLIVGTLNSIGLLALGIPHPFLFGFMVSILTFIPYVGIIIASLLPITVAWLTYNSIWYPIGVIAIFAFVQYLEANLIFPFAVSNRLNINTFATLIAIIYGGILWGAAGMILFVPFIAILKLIADNTPGLRSVSMFLSTKEPANTSSKSL